MLEGDLECKDMVAFSVYDTKPVHFFSMTCTNLCWKKNIIKGLWQGLWNQHCHEVPPHQICKTLTTASWIM